MQCISYRDLTVVINLVLTDCTEEIKSKLTALLPRLGQTVIDSLSVQCCLSLKSVYDIPRLFRRTNREVTEIICQSFTLTRCACHFAIIKFLPGTK